VVHADRVDEAKVALSTTSFTMDELASKLAEVLRV